MTKGLLPANRRNLGRGIGPGRASVEAEPRQGPGLAQPLLGANLAKARYRCWQAQCRGWQGMAMTRRAAVPSLLDNLPVWVSSESTCSGRGCDRRSGRFPTFEDRKRQLGNQALPTEGCVRETRSYLPVTSLIGRRSPAERCGGRASPAGDNRGAYLCCRLRVAPLVGDVVR